MHNRKCVHSFLKANCRHGMIDPTLANLNWEKWYLVQELYLTKNTVDYKLQSRFKRHKQYNHSYKWYGFTNSACQTSKTLHKNGLNNVYPQTTVNDFSFHNLSENILNHITRNNLNFLNYDLSNVFEYNFKTNILIVLV